MTISGLERTPYLDKAGGLTQRTQDDMPIRFSGETDRVYLETMATCSIDDPGLQRRIVVSKDNSRSTVVWNPWIAKARAMQDFGDEEWRGMVCVETANVGVAAVPLAPGERHRMTVSLAVEHADWPADSRAGDAVNVGAARRATSAMFLICGTATSSWAPMIPFVKARLGLDEGTLGLILLVFGGGSMVAMPLAGVAIHVWGSRRVVALTSLATCVALPLLALPLNAALVTATLFVFGAALGAMDVAMNAQALAVQHAAARPIMSGFHALFSVGGLAGAALLSALLRAGVGLARVRRPALPWCWRSSPCRSSGISSPTMEPPTAARSRSCRSLPCSSSARCVSCAFSARAPCSTGARCFSGSIARSTCPSRASATPRSRSRWPSCD